MHINILPPQGRSADVRPVAEMHALLQQLLEDPSKNNALWACPPLQGLHKIEWHQVCRDDGGGRGEREMQPAILRRERTLEQPLRREDLLYGTTLTLSYEATLLTPLSSYAQC